MIDYHCHLLPNLDDGAVTLGESLAMARALADFGYTTVCCTPHCIKGYYDHSAQDIREATRELQAAVDTAGIPLQLRPGMEYMLDECFGQFADDLLPLGDSNLILCEGPQQAHPIVVQQCLELIIEKGFTPLIAHPERTGHFYEMLMRCEMRDERGEVRDTKCEETQPDEKPGSFFSPLTSYLSLLSSFFSPLTSHFALLKKKTTINPTQRRFVAKCFAPRTVEKMRFSSQQRIIQWFLRAAGAAPCL